MPKHSTESGFTLIEVLVAFTILATVLGALYAALGGGARHLAGLEQRARIMAHAESHLDRLIASRALAPGTSSGTYADGTAWQLTTAMLPALAEHRDAVIKPVSLELTALNARGGALLRLRSIALVKPER